MPQIKTTPFKIPDYTPEAVLELGIHIHREFIMQALEWPLGSPPAAYAKARLEDAGFTRVEYSQGADDLLTFALWWQIMDMTANVVIQFLGWEAEDITVFFPVESTDIT